MPETAAPETTPEAPLTVTDEAAASLKEQIAGIEADVDAVRLLVQAGGCCGMQYALALAQGEPNEIETSFDAGGVTFYVETAVVDAIKGSTLEIVEVPGHGQGFKISNPNVSGDSCGC